MAKLVLALLLYPVQAWATTRAPFYWLPSQVDGVKLEHAAMLLPALITNAKGALFFQLDIGVAESVLYEAAFRGAVKHAGEGESAKRFAADPILPSELSHGYLLNGRIGPFVLRDEKFRAIDVFGRAKSKVVGSVGTSTFANHIVAIDYISNRIGVDNAVAGDFANARFVPFSGRSSGRVALSLQIGTRQLGEVLFDTGSSERGLVLFALAQWSDLTGSRIGPDTAWRSIGLSWGKPTRCTAAMSLEPVQFAGMDLGRMMLEYCEIEGAKAHADSYVGPVGNKLFVGKATVVLDMRESKFGVRWSSAPSATN